MVLLQATKLQGNYDKKWKCYLYDTNKLDWELESLMGFTPSEPWSAKKNLLRA